MKRYEMVKSKNDFNLIINEGKKISNEVYIIYYKESNFFKPHFGLAVGKKLGRAVDRNKIKRQLRNIIDNNKLLFKNNYNYIIMIKKPFISKKYEENEKLMIDLIGKDKNEK